MIDYQITIGLVPIRRDVTPRPGPFNAERAEERGKKAVDYIKKNYADSKSINSLYRHLMYISWKLPWG